MDEILKNVSDVTTQKPVELEVDIQPVNRAHRLLQKWKILPSKRTFTIKPVTYGNLIRISKLLLAIDPALFQSSNLLESNYKAISQHAETVAQVVAIAIHNGRSEPPASLVKFILYNFTSHEMLATLGIVLRQMNLTGFMSSIVSIRGLNVLESGIVNAKSVNGSETSPTDQGRQIAPGN